MEILTSKAGNNYIAFGDDEHRYELIENAFHKKEMAHDFELRAENDPDTVFARFSIVSSDTMVPECTFARALRQSLEIARNDTSLMTEHSLKVIDHLCDSLEKAYKESGKSITLTDESMNIIPATMREHVQSGGQIYETERTERYGKSFISMSPSGLEGINTYVSSDCIVDDDFTKAVASMNEQNVSMEV